MQGVLPAEFTSFVGRRHELREIQRLLGDVRLITLTGAGGVGKTRLAIQISRAVKHGMPGGTWFVDLASLNDPDLVGTVIADALELRHRSAAPIIEHIVEYLAARRALLVLDNCEHVIAAVASAAEAILKGAPGVKIIATSRTSLRVSGEHVVSVGSLPTPRRDQPLSPESAPQFDAVRLFVERARAARPGFHLDNANLQAVIDICARVDGIPLAIELATARLRALSVSQIATYLDERFDVLFSRESTPSPRQGSIKAVLDWSYGLCSSHEQLLWTRLGVFQSSFDLDAAASVCSGDGLQSADILDLVCGLVDKSIVAADEIAGTVRYQMLESVRAYARERLQLSGAEAPVRLRHAHYFLGLAVASEASRFTRQEHQSLQALHADRENLGAAITTLLREHDPDSALALATSLGFYWVACGYLHEGNQFLDRTLEAAQLGSPRRARGLLMAAWVALNRGELAIGDERLDESWSLGAMEDDSSCIAHAVELKGLASMLREDWQRALYYYAVALDSHRARDDAFGIARTLIRTATVWTLSGQPDRASEFCREAIEMTNARGDTWCKGLLLTAMTITAWEQGNLRDARALATESVRLKLKFNDRLGIAESLEILAWLAAAEKNFREAARLLGSARPLWDAAGGASVQMPRGHQICVRRVWDALGPAEYMSCLEWGKAHGWGELVGETETVLSGRKLAVFDPSPLTPREYEVATLVAEGLTNRDIASRLVISPRTAEGHIQHILVKLGFTSRTRIASWVAGHDQPRVNEPLDAPP